MAEQSEVYLQLPISDNETFYGGYDDIVPRHVHYRIYRPLLLSPSVKARGQARDIVKRFALTNDNFQLVWDSLH